ncbi:hypothetical protein ACQ4LD_21435, partial [Sphingobacterium daejeonense]
EMCIRDRLTNQAVIEKLRTEFGNKVTHISEPKGLLTVETDTENIIDLLSSLKKDEYMQFIYLSDITAVHQSLIQCPGPSIPSHT